MTKEISLTRGLVCLVDDEDFDYLIQWSWYAQPGPNTFYGIRKGPRDYFGWRPTLSIHREVLNLPWPRNGWKTIGEVDHINRNGLDCRKENLRITDKKGNAQNRDNGKLEPRVCLECLSDFQPWNSKSKFCSSRCFGIYNTTETRKLVPGS